MNDKKSHFENAVIQASNTAIPNVQGTNINIKNKPVVTKPIIKAGKGRMIMIIFAFLAVCIGLILLLRGIFSINSPYFNNSALVSSINKILNPNKATELNGFQLDSNGNPIPPLGQNIKSPFTPDYQDSKVWLNINDPNGVRVGFIDTDDIFDSQYQLFAGATQIHLYEEGSISYVVNPMNGIKATLFIQKTGSNAMTIKVLNDGESFTDNYFEPKERLIYYSFIDSTATVHIEATNMIDKTFNIFTSGLLSSQLKIIYVDNIKGLIYLQDTKGCVLLTLKDKTLDNYNCANIKSNNLDKLFSTNSNPQGVYDQQIQGQILQTSSSIKDNKVLLTGANGEVFKNLTYHNNFLYFVSYKLKQITNNVWTETPQTIEKLDLTTLQRTAITNNMPTQQILKVIPAGNRLYVVVNNGNNTSKLLEYNVNPIESIVVGSGPSSYPVSYPLSSPLSYTVQSLYWTEYDLSNPLQVDLLQARYYNS